LDVRDEKWQMEVRFDRGAYTIYVFRLDDAGKPFWTRLAANGGPTPDGARLRARKFWRDIVGEAS
jgi:hypothetical protein